jgi:AcrR family transcriptional regulator
MDERRKGTRAKIQEVALDLFAEQGYEKTSLREIADRLGVTKAALYYHFKAKEDIITSIFEDIEAEMDEIIEWASEQPATVETRREVVRRYGRITVGKARKLMRFMSENHSAMRELKVGNEMRDRMNRLATIVTNDKATLVEQIRIRVAFFTMSIGIFATQDLDATDDERAAASLDIALELVSTNA